MAIQVSPGINISEIDLTQIVPAVSTTDAAIAGVFRWGPVNTPTLVTSEADLVAQFGQPETSGRTVSPQWTNSETWFTARNFLSYSNSLFVTRVVASPNGPDNNPDSYVPTTQETKQATSTLFNAKYVGKLGNSLRTSYCKSGSFDPVARNETLTLPYGSSQATISGFSSSAGTQLVAGVGDNILLSTGAVMKVASVSNAIQDRAAGNVKTFDASDAGIVILAADTITIPTHGYSTGDIVQYDVGTSTQTTFVNLTITDTVGGIAFDDPTPDLAIGDKVTVTGTVSGNEGVIAAGEYLVGATNGTGTATLTDLNGAAISTTATISGVITDVNSGTTVKFISASNTITGLQDNGIYVVIKVDVDTIQLKVQHNSVTANVITAVGVGTAHTFTRLQSFKITVAFTTPYKTSVEDYSGRIYSTQWGDADLFDADPVADTMHLVVRDNDGEISGLADTILETYSNVSWIDGRLNEDSSTNYITDRLEQQSNWIQCTDAQADDISAAEVTYDSITDMTTGSDGMDEGTMRIGDMALGYDTFNDKTQLDISFVLQGKPRGTVLANYIIDNVCEVRKDCVAFISPELTDMTAQLIVTFAGQINASNYAFIDSGYKYQLDKYADRYRWVPLNGDIAGLCARTDDERDPWFSPAGYARGEIKNATKLRFNANQSQRDLMYKANVNPVISRPGTGGGHILFGDKTNAGIASAFDRINVRRLFIVLEKSIEVAAKATLFEFNDEFTRAQFKNMIEPFLRDVQGRRGIYDFMVVADETNNTAEVIDSNRFVGDIYIKPVRSINFIQLNFVAVRSGVEFSEVVGNF